MSESIPLTRVYLRASTDEQDANRAREELEAFAHHHGLTIAGSYKENESGASFQRPELIRLLDDSRPGDILLVEQVDRLSRLNGEDWKRLRTKIADKQIRVVALDLPTSHTLIAGGDEFQSRMLDAINAMMLDMLAAIARKDYEDRRRRQQQGIEKAKAQGKYRGRPENVERNALIEQLLREGKSWDQTMRLSGASRYTIAKLAKRIKETA